MRLSVVIATFDAPDWLEKVLWGYAAQDHRDFEILVADDGSGDETRARIDRLRRETGLDLRHLWHERNGYRRQTILNRAIVEARTDYLVFTDGDCIPRRDFLAVHAARAEPGRFLSGGYCKLPLGLSKLISREDIAAQRCFDLGWLARNGLGGLKALSQKRKLAARGVWADFLDAVTPANASFNNCNSSAWRRDLLAVNGYDERMQYGGADREIGERLEHLGVRGKQIRHRALVVHLDHARGYKTRESIERNLGIRRQVRRERRAWTEHGIVPGARRA
jgi:glycosyltransferase involved in cell wall biosynthesis